MCLKKYHPSRVLTLVYQPFAIGTMAILAYNEAKINTRKRNIAGYILFTASTLMLMVVSNMNNSYLLWFNLFPINFNSWLIDSDNCDRWIWPRQEEEALDLLLVYVQLLLLLELQMLMFKVGWLETWLSCVQNSCRLDFMEFVFNWSCTLKCKEICILPHLGCLFLQSFFAGLAASGALTSGLRLITKAAFDKSKNGPRKGVSMSLFFEQ